MKNDKLKKIVTITVLPLVIIYLECLLHFSVGFSFADMNIPGMLCMSVAFAGIGVLICTFIRSDKAIGWVVFAFAELATAVFCLMYFTFDAYKVFMTPGMIVSEAGDVATGFTDTVLTVIGKGFIWILVYEIPAIALLVCAVKKYFGLGIENLKSSMIHALIAAVSIGVFYGTAYLINSKDSTYSTGYEFTEAVKKFGLVQGIILDTTKEARKNDENAELQFVTQSTPTPSPENLPTAEAETEEIDYGINVMDIDFQALSEDKTLPGAIRSLNKYVASLTPSNKNKYTGMLKGKNLILITAEALTKEVVDKERTPTLYRLTNNAVVFEDFYQPAWGGSTSTGEFSFLTGLVPVVPGAASISAYKNMYFTMGNQLQREGYFSMAFHNGLYTYYGRDVTHPNFGYTRFLASGDMLKVSPGFPPSDLEMMENSIDMYIDNQPFSVYYMTISGHANYGLTPDVNVPAAKNADIVKDMPYGQKVKAYYACNQELEYALEYLLKRLEEKGILDDTVIALVPDHYPYGLCRSMTWDNTADSLAELYGYKADTDRKRDHSVGFIWSTSLEEAGPLVIEEPTYSLDMLPTLSNLFGLEFDSRLLVGRDVFSDQEALVLWNDGNFLTDKGYYDGRTFTPENPEDDTDYTDYVQNMKTVVANKRTFSENALNYDYYARLFGKDDCKGNEGWEKEYEPFMYKQY